MRFLLSLALAASFSALTAGPAFAQSPIVIKFSHVVAADTPKGKAVEYFKKLVEERSKGKIQVQVYPNSQLYKDQEELEALQLGAVQMLAPSLGKFGPMGFKEFDVFNLPYIFDSSKDVERVTSGKIGQELRPTRRCASPTTTRGSRCECSRRRFPRPKFARSARFPRSWRFPRSTRPCRRVSSTVRTFPP